MAAGWAACSEDWGTGLGVSRLGSSDFSLWLGPTRKPDPDTHGAVLITSGSWHSAGWAGKPAAGAGRARPGQEAWPACWVPAMILLPLGFPARCLLENVPWPGPAGLRGATRLRV